METMTPSHPEWGEFIKRLCGPEGINFRDENGHLKWSCDESMERPIARRILKEHYPTVDIEATMKYFEDHGGYCDCEIAFNVGKPED